MGIATLVLSGISKLVDLVGVWQDASAERRAEIEAQAKSFVDALDAIFLADDARDKAEMDALQAKIDGTE